MRYLAVDLHPTEVLLVDPKLAFHLGEHLAVLALRAITRMWRGLKYVGRSAPDDLFVDEVEVEGLEQVAEERPVFLVLAEPCGPLVRRFMLQFFEILLVLPLFLDGWKLSVVFHELFEVSAVDKNYSGDVDILRFHVPERVQAPILITLHVCVMVTRLPTALGGRDRQLHNLTGVPDACMILRFFRPVTLR